MDVFISVGILRQIIDRRANHLYITLEAMREEIIPMHLWWKVPWKKGSQRRRIEEDEPIELLNVYRLEPCAPPAKIVSVVLSVNNGYVVKGKYRNGAFRAAYHEHIVDIRIFLHPVLHEEREVRYPIVRFIVRVDDEMSHFSFTHRVQATGLTRRAPPGNVGSFGAPLKRLFGDITEQKNR